MAVPSVAQEFTAHNPDGSTVQLFATGTPAAATFASTDGRAVVRNPETGFYEEATPSAVRTHVAAALPADRSRWQERRRERIGLAQRPAGATARARRPASPTNVIGLCLLVEFPHEVTTGHSRDEVDDFCNKVGYSGFGNHGSVFDYFQTSPKAFLLTNVVADYFTAAHDRSYYTDETRPRFSRAKELAVEGLDHLKGTGFDFDQLSVDDGGFVYALNMLYTGENSNSFAQGLWPHQNSLVDDYQAPDGRTFRDYQITDMRTELTMGTFVHESGHLVCDFPDMYNVSDFNSRGAGGFCLMGHYTQNPDFRTNPVQVSGYLKRVAGWTTRESELTAGMLQTVDAGRNDFLLYRKNDHRVLPTGEPPAAGSRPEPARRRRGDLARRRAGHRADSRDLLGPPLRDVVGTGGRRVPPRGRPQLWRRPRPVGSSEDRVLRHHHPQHEVVEPSSSPGWRSSRSPRRRLG